MKKSAQREKMKYVLLMIVIVIFVAAVTLAFYYAKNKKEILESPEGIFGPSCENSIRDCIICDGSGGGEVCKCDYLEVWHWFWGYYTYELRCGWVDDSSGYCNKKGVQEGGIYCLPPESSS